MKAHFIAIGGSAMHNLAIALHKKGYDVSGSDDEIFEPSRSRLKKYGLLPESNGWNPEKINSELDFIILGMHARKDNPELKRAEELGLIVLSYPQFLYEQSSDKTRVVIAGSHGKTTITAMVLHVLHYHQKDCDYMVGAQLEGFDTMVKLTDYNDFMLLEGDEYLSSPLDNRPKFFHYKPNICLLSGIAWDHINVFKTYQDYLKQFEMLPTIMEAGGALVYNALDPEVVKVVDKDQSNIKKFSYKLPEYEIRNSKIYLQSPYGEIPLQIFGKHNLNNLEGARLICNQMGVADEEFYEAIGSFKGASRRLEKIRETDELRIYRDFAHAPSKVKASTEAVAESFGKQKFIACLELHTFSSLNKDFLPHYANSLNAAEHALVYFNPDVVKHKNLIPINKDDVKQAFGGQVEVFEDNKALLKRLKVLTEPSSTLLIMSSGSFDGIDWKQEFGHD